MLRIFTFLALCVITQGCIGIARLKVRTETFQDPSIRDQACAACVSPRGGQQTNALNYNANWLDAHWGKPRTIKFADKGNPEDIWVYKFGTTWSGVIPVVLVPIPLLFPTGREQVCFALRDNHVISAKVRRLRSVGAGYGCYPGICGFGFGAFSWDD